jgi:hypothetical protein
VRPALLQQTHATQLKLHVHEQQDIGTTDSRAPCAISVGRRQSTLRSLKAAVADAARTGNGALCVRTLKLPAILYSADVAEAAAASFPAVVAMGFSAFARHAEAAASFTSAPPCQQTQRRPPTAWLRALRLRTVVPLPALQRRASALRSAHCIASPYMAWRPCRAASATLWPQCRGSSSFEHQAYRYRQQTAPTRHP